MMAVGDNIVPFTRRLYKAKTFTAPATSGVFEASGTLCGHIDFVVPGHQTICFTPDEALAVINVLKAAREDVLENSEPLHDPRIIDRKE